MSWNPNYANEAALIGSPDFGVGVRRAFQNMVKVDVTPYAIPWSGIDVPMVSALPQGANDRAEVNLLVGEGLARMVYRKATNRWYPVTAGAPLITQVAQSGPWPQNTTVTIVHGGTVEIVLRGVSAYTGTVGATSLPIRWDSVLQDLTYLFMNEINSHKTFPGKAVTLTDVAPGDHTVGIGTPNGATSDSNDTANFTIYDWPGSEVR